MAKISRDFTQPLKFIQEVDTFAHYSRELIKDDPLLTYTVDVSGELNLTDETLGFDSREELREQLEGIALEDVHSFHLWVVAEGKKKDELFSQKKLRIFGMRRKHSDVIDIAATENEPSVLKSFMNGIPDLMGVELRTYSTDDKRADNLQAAATKAIGILQDLPSYQTRLKEAFQSEKDVQNFVYPILKSHFSDLVEETYLPDVAGASSKPDFGLEDVGLAFELKFLTKKSYKVIGEEIATDLLRYFGKSSPYESLIVFIYDMSHQPLPAGFISDLERLPQIAKVIISPGVKP